MAQWRTLPVAESPELPPLLVSAAFTNATYRILVSDLAHVWVEDLDRRSICMRGWKENTIIDPSDTPENMERFLGYLRSALDDSHLEHDATALKVSGYTGSETGDDGIVLEVTCELGELGQLKWPLYLKQTPPTGLATELVIPLLRAQSARTHEITALANLLGHKDNIISRLLDALESASIGLEKAFPTLAPGSTVRKKVSRSAAEDKLQGLAPFQLSQWKDDVGDALSPGAGGVSGLVEDVFGENGVQYEPGRDKLDNIDLAGWWRGYRGSTGPKKAKRITDEVPQRPSTPPPAEKSDEDEVFQVQTTPERLRPNRLSPNKTPTRLKTSKPLKTSTPPKTSKPPKPANNEEDESTASEASPISKNTPRLATRALKSPEPVANVDDDDDDGEFQRQATPPRLKPKAATPIRKSPAKLGSLGGSKKTPAKKSPPPKAVLAAQDESTASEADDEPPRAAAPTAPVDDDTTASEADDVPPPTRASATSAPKRGGLGRIGGKKPESRQPTTSPTTGTAPSSVFINDGPTTESPASPPPVRRLGKIGGAKIGTIGSSGNPSDTTSSAAARGRSREATKAETPLPPARETSEERANRIRDGLKAERDRKAAAGPVKKKRRF